MKKRQKFVSNSSSSSFVVMNDEPIRDSKIKDFYRKLKAETELNSNSVNTISLPSHDIGCTEFGWEFKDYVSLGDKLNFCVIQAIYAYLYCNKYGPIDNIQKWVKEHIPEIKNVVFKNIVYFNFEHYEGGMYIDHQSAYNEGSNCEVVDDYDTLCKFMSTHSYIQGGNDNAC